MKAAFPRDVAFPLLLASFAAVGIPAAAPVFNYNTRWFFLLAAAAWLLLRGRLFLVFGNRFGPILAVYILYCAMTSLWSQVPLLSFLKSVAFALVSVTFASAAQDWAQNARTRSSLSYLQPLIAVTLFAGLWGLGDEIELAPGMVLYKGGAGNSNFFGMLAAASMTYGIGCLFDGYRTAPYRFATHVVLLTILSVMLVLSGSRASMLVVVMASTMLFLTFNFTKTLIAMMVAASIGLAGALVVPEIQQGVYSRFIVKSSYRTDIFGSRRETWAASYDAAKQGDIFGLGYGVSAGQSNFTVGLSAVDYGREKGNAQLAVWEETGLLGCAFYALLLVRIFAELATAWAQSRQAKWRRESALLLGLLIGLTAQSAFEAWWTSPGSMEACLFWGTAGVAMGLSRKMRACAPRSVAGAASPRHPCFDRQTRKIQSWT